MFDLLRSKSWSPYAVGAWIGVLSWFAFATADKPIGITTPFEHTAALSAKAVAPEVLESNPYYDKERPKIGWEWMLVIGVFFGALLSSKLSGDRGSSLVPLLWSWRFGPAPSIRIAGAFVGAGLMMIGARLAQGCTSGHGISGTLQLAVSSWVFILVAFSAAVAAAFLTFGKEGARHV